MALTVAAVVAGRYLTLVLFEFGDFPVMRKLFLNVKGRAERFRFEMNVAGALANRGGIR